MYRRWLLAVAVLARAQDGQPCDLARSMSLEQSGHAAFEQRQYDTAVPQLQSAFDACPSQRGILLELAEAQTYRRDFEQAIRTLNQFLEPDPSSVPGRLALANVYFMAQRFDEAREETARVLRLEPAQPTALKLKGNIEYLVGSFEDAESTFIELLDRYPRDEEGAYMLGRIYYQEGRVGQAIGQFERVLRVNPRAYKAYDNLGLSYQARGEKDKAIHAFLEAIKVAEKDQPDYDWPFANLAKLFLESGDNQKAFALASQAADRNPRSARNFYLGGKALCQMNKTDLCLNWLQRSAALDPNYPEPVYSLARLYRKLGQGDKAKQALDKFRELKAKQPEKRK